MAKFKFNPNAPYNKYFGSVVNALVSLSIAKKVDKNTSYWLANLVLHWLKKNYQHDNEKFLFANYWEYKRAYSKAKHFFYRLVTNISNSEQFNNILNEMSLNDKDLESVKQKLESYNNVSNVQIQPKTYTRTKEVSIDKVSEEVRKAVEKVVPDAKTVTISTTYQKEFRRLSKDSENKLQVFFTEIVNELKRAKEENKIDPLVHDKLIYLLGEKAREINKKLDMRIIEKKIVHYLPSDKDVYSLVLSRLNSILERIKNDDDRAIVLLLNKLVANIMSNDESKVPEILAKFRERVLRPKRNSVTLQQLLNFASSVLYVTKALFYLSQSLYQLLLDVLKGKISIEDATKVLTSIIDAHNLIDIVPRDSSELDIEFLDTQRVSDNISQEIDVSKASLNEKLIA